MDEVTQLEGSFYPEAELVELNHCGIYSPVELFPEPFKLISLTKEVFINVCLDGDDFSKVIVTKCRRIWQKIGTHQF